MLRLAPIAVLSLVLSAGAARAQGVSPKMQPLITPTTREASLAVEQAGQIRLRLSPPSQGDWSVTVQTADDTFTIDPASFERFRIYASTVELPVRRGGPVTIKAQGAPVGVLWESSVAASDSQALFRQGGLLEPMDAAFRSVAANAKVVQQSAAVVRVRWSAPGAKTRWCTGVKIDAARILTNRHCLPPSYSLETPVGEIAVQFGAFAGALDDVAETLPATAIRLASAGATNEMYERDLAVLNLKSAPKGALYSAAAVPLASESKSNRPSMLLTVWSFDAPKGKAVSRDKGCVADIGQNAAWWCEGQATFWHQCEAEQGSSGSPILDAESGQLVGLHYAGVRLNGGNCALRAETIRQELQAIAN